MLCHLQGDTTFMLKIVGLTSTSALTKRIAEALYSVQYDPNLYSCQVFSDGEMEVCFTDTVRGDDVYIIGSTVDSDSIIELLMAIDAAKHASARTVTAVIPYFGYARQDRKSKPRVSVGAKVLAKCIESAGADRVITIDLHASQEQCFFDIPVDHIPAESVFVDYIKSTIIDADSAILAAPDAGAAKRVESYSKHLGIPMIMCHKHREKANEVASMLLIGNPKGKQVYLIDDLCDTGGTLCKAAQLLKDSGALSVTVLVTHGVFSGTAIKRLYEESAIDRVVVTDTIDQPLPNFKFIKLSVARLLASVIDSISNNSSISKHFV